MDFSKLHNPFDFANPVMNPKLFAGRKSELEDIEYYLNHAKNAPRAINLALIGDRASGKTSLLNMIEKGAKLRDFCTVRIDLDESDVETQLALFVKLFDGIISTACKENAFGGIHGKTYDTYRSMIDAFEIPEDRTFCPFIFPMQYAKAMSKGNITISVTDRFKDDISLIQIEVGKPIAILIDECDVLTHSKVHLEKLRNIFMNLQGFFLVFTGTGVFFPIINDVFSPIARQFKIINVKPFENTDDTRDCIVKPLIGLGIDAEEIFDFETITELESIHNISGGRPYEIQLLFHQLFKRLQQGKANKLQLSVDVLDDVLNELQALQDVTVRPTVQKIKNLSRDELSALGALLKCNKNITFEQAWYLENNFNEDTKWTEASLKEKLDLLVSKKLIKIENEILFFAGDDFDRIYCKYYSRKQDAIANINDMPFDGRLSVEIRMLIRKSKPSFDIIGHQGEYIEESEIEKFIDDFSNRHYEFFEKNIELAKVLYMANVQNQDLESFPFIVLSLKFASSKFQTWYTIDNPQPEIDANAYLEEFERIFKHINERSEDFNSELSLKVFLIPVIQIDNIVSGIDTITSQNLKSSIAEVHINEMVECYTQIQDLDGAKYHGELALKFQPEPEDTSNANNLGYLFMAIGELEKAKSLFEMADRKSTDLNDELPLLFPIGLSYLLGNTDALIKYNLAIVHSKLGDFKKGIELLENVLEKTKGSKHNQCACLFIPEIVNDQLIFHEILEPDLQETSKTSIETLKTYINILEVDSE